MVQSRIGGHGSQGPVGQRRRDPPQGNTLNEWLAAQVAAAGQVLDSHTAGRQPDETGGRKDMAGQDRQIETATDTDAERETTK